MDQKTTQAPVPPMPAAAPQAAAAQAVTVQPPSIPAPPTQPAVDIERFSRNIARMVEEGGKALTRTLKFKDFSEAFAFLTRVAMHAEKVDHHPEFTNVWNRVDFRLTSHDAGGVTERDIKLAQAINRLAGGE